MARLTYGQYESMAADKRAAVDDAIDFATRVGFGDRPAADDRLGVLAYVLKSTTDAETLGRIGRVFTGYRMSEAAADLRWRREEALLVRKSVEVFLRSSALVPEQVKSRLGGPGVRSALEGKLRVHGVEAFACAAAREQHRRLPELGDTGLSRAIAAWNSIAGTTAFGTRLEGEGVSLRAGLVDLHNGVHEALHVFCGAGWHTTEWPSAEHLRSLRETIQEGVTEYLTRAIAGGGGYYDTEVLFVERLLAEKGVSTEQLAGFYFGPVESFLQRVGLLAAPERSGIEDLDDLQSELAQEKAKRS